MTTTNANYAQYVPAVATTDAVQAAQAAVIAAEPQMVAAITALGREHGGLKVWAYSLFTFRTFALMSDSSGAAIKSKDQWIRDRFRIAADDDGTKAGSMLKSMRNRLTYLQREGGSLLAKDGQMAQTKTSADDAIAKYVARAIKGGAVTTDGWVRAATAMVPALAGAEPTALYGLLTTLTAVYVRRNDEVAAQAPATETAPATESSTTAPAPVVESKGKGKGKAARKAA